MEEIMDNLICAVCGENLYKYDGYHHCAKCNKSVKVDETVCKVCSSPLFVYPKGKVFCSNPKCNSMTISDTSLNYNCIVAYYLNEFAFRLEFSGSGMEVRDPSMNLHIIVPSNLLKYIKKFFKHQSSIRNIPDQYKRLVK